jgi:hypothetical protein
VSINNFGCTTPRLPYNKRGDICKPGWTEHCRERISEHHRRQLTP